MVIFPADILTLMIILMANKINIAGSAFPVSRFEFRVQAPRTQHPEPSTQYPAPFFIM